MATDHTLLNVVRSSGPGKSIDAVLIDNLENKPGSVIAILRHSMTQLILSTNWIWILATLSVLLAEMSCSMIATILHVDTSKLLITKVKYLSISKIVPSIQK